MIKLKKLFSTPQKAVTTIVCAAALAVLLGAGTVFAAGAISENSSIGAENALNFAFADAGVDPVSADRVKTEFSYEHGQFVYEVEFTAGNSEYDYHIKASDGTVVKKQIEVIAKDGSVKAAEETAAAEITLEQAKEIALADAGLSITEVTFTKEKSDMDDGLSLYDIDFFKDNVEYEYEINAVTGAVYSKSRETLVTQTAQNTAPAASENPAPAPENVTTAPENAAPAPENVTTAPENTAPVPAESSAKSGYIGVEQAKSIALGHAGVSEVTYTKAKLDDEDGQIVYEIEFYKDGMEYDYTIRAVDGSIMEYESEWDD